MFYDITDKMICIIQRECCNFITYNCYKIMTLKCLGHLKHFLFKIKKKFFMFRYMLGCISVKTFGVLLHTERERERGGGEREGGTYFR